MPEDACTLPNAWELAERRLELLELERDPYTIRRARDHVREGASCLEADAGRGSIVQGLCDAGGPSVRVARRGWKRRGCRRFGRTSGVAREPLEAAIHLLDDSHRWFYGPAMVAVSARRPRHA